MRSGRHVVPAMAAMQAPEFRVEVLDDVDGT
jgi:hypothetical protein